MIPRQRPPLRLLLIIPLLAMVCDARGQQNVLTITDQRVSGRTLASAAGIVIDRDELPETHAASGSRIFSSQASDSGFAASASASLSWSEVKTGSTVSVNFSFAVTASASGAEAGNGSTHASARTEHRYNFNITVPMLFIIDVEQAHNTGGQADLRLTRVGGGNPE